MTFKPTILHTTEECSEFLKYELGHSIPTVFLGLFFKIIKNADDQILGYIGRKIDWEKTKENFEKKEECECPSGPHTKESQGFYLEIAALSAAYEDSFRTKGRNLVERCKNFQEMTLEEQSKKCETLIFQIAHALVIES